MNESIFESMSEETTYLLASLGCAFLAIFGIVFFILLIMWLGELIEKIYYKYKIKHRFDRKPTAKCYCIDCRYYEPEHNRCQLFDICIRSDSFCVEALPIGGEKQ